MSTLSFLEDHASSTDITVFKDPFQQNCIDEITISYRRPIFATNHVWTGRVDFKHGLTSGTQKTPECNTWEELMLQLKAIYTSLNAKPQ